jgi:hypothetical protein
MQTIAELHALPPGDKVNAVRGILRYAGPRQDKTRPDGEQYTSQDFQLEDGATKISGVIYDHYPLDKYVGQEVIFCSLKSRNGRFGGVTVAQVSSGNLFTKSPHRSSLRVSKAGGFHTPDTYATLCRTTKRPE